MGSHTLIGTDKVGLINPVIKAKRHIVLKKAEGEDDKYNVVNSRSFIRQSKSNFSKYVNQEMGSQQTPITGGDKVGLVSRAKANLQYLEDRLNKF